MEVTMIYTVSAAIAFGLVFGAFVTLLIVDLGCYQRSTDAE